MPKRTKISLIIIGTLIVLSIIGLTYAYIGRKEIEGNEDNTIILSTIDYGQITVSFEGGNNSINAEMIDLPQEEAGIDKLYMIKFQINSTANVNQDIVIKWQDIINNFCLYRNATYQCTDNPSDTYVGDELTYALYNCTLSQYNNVTTADDSDITSCTKISNTTEQRLPSTGATSSLHTATKVTLGPSSTTYYIVRVKLQNIDANQNYNMGKTLSGSINVEFYVPTLANMIIEAHPPVSDAIASTYVTSSSGINFSAINSPTNGQGLYINDKVNVAGDPTLGTIKYFRGGTYCAYTDYLTEDASGTKCIAAGGTWADYHCSLSDSITACTATGGTFYELKNNVMFAGFAWKIIRINEDNSIRMIYNGASPTARGTSAQTISTMRFNSSHNDNAYVGYMYGATGQTTYESTHANINNSSIKTALDTWHQSNLTSYNSKIGDAGFCNDRSLYSGAGYGVENTYYNPYRRIDSLKTPTFNCPQINDLFTTAMSSTGNKKLTYPIGLITIDEVTYAGGKSNTSNFMYYLTSGSYYWTISPSQLYASSTGTGWRLNPGGDTTGYVVLANWDGVRPVISLKPSVIVSSGTGTLTDPWVVTS